jgi:hypothetical protein
MHDESCFITLTYDDDCLPFGETLVKKDFQDFMKRARKKFGKMRYYHCGEYGETTHRPHYHALLFGFRPPDPILFSTSGEFPLYESPTLTETWGLGFATFGDVTFDTAAYCSRYTTKKITGDPAKTHYEWIDPETGEIVDRLPEYSTMSRRPGIGMPWLERYGRDAYEKDQVILNGRPMPPPRAYDKVFEHTNPEMFLTLKRHRKRNAIRVTNRPTDRQLRAGSIFSAQKLKKRDFT